MIDFLFATLQKSRMYLCKKHILQIIWRHILATSANTVKNHCSIHHHVFDEHFPIIATSKMHYETFFHTHFCCCCVRSYEKFDKQVSAKNPQLLDVIPLLGADVPYVHFHMRHTLAPLNNSLVQLSFLHLTQIRNAMAMLLRPPSDVTAWIVVMSWMHCGRSCYISLEHQTKLFPIYLPFSVKNITLI